MGNFLTSRETVSFSRKTLLYAVSALYLLFQHALLVLTSFLIHSNIFAIVYKFIQLQFFYCGPGSSVGIATDYGLDGPGLNPGGDEIFRPSRPALGSTEPPIKLVPGLFGG